MKTKKLKYAIITSVVAICICLALLAGSTYAWFTDTLVSKGNVIQAGSVKVSADVYKTVDSSSSGAVTVLDGTEDSIGNANSLTVESIISKSALTTTKGNSAKKTPDADGNGYYAYGSDVTFSFNLEDDGTDLAKEGAIFNADEENPLEPGVTEPYARIIEVTNTGSLDAAVKLSFSATGNLVQDMWASVLPVDYTEAVEANSDAGTDPVDASIVVGKDADGNQATFAPKAMSDINGSNTAEAVLAPGASTYLLLVFGIYADCSNEGNGQNFDLEVAVLATQSVGHKDGDTGVQAQFPDWNGTDVDTGWYDKEDTVHEYTIYTAAELAGFAAIVNDEKSEQFTEDWTVYLGADIDLEGFDWTPIGIGTTDTDHTSVRAFRGIFDGQGHTIYNLNVYVESATQWVTGCGLFGYVSGGQIKNVNIHNVTSEGERLVGTLVGEACSYYHGNETDGTHLQIENCHVTGLVQVSGHHQVGGLVGSATEVIFDGCSVEGVSGSYVKSTYAVPDESEWSSDKHESDYDGDAAGGLVGYLHTSGGSVSSGSLDATKGTSDFNYMTGCTASGLEISGCRKVGGLIGHNCGAIELSGCTVKDCDITLMYNESYSAALEENNDTVDVNTGYTTTKAKLFVGALVGEFEWEQKVTSDCTVDNVTVKYLVEYGIRGNQVVDEYGEYSIEFGLFGGSRNQAGFDSNNNNEPYSKVTYVTDATSGATATVNTTNFTTVLIGTNGLPV